MRWSTRIAAAMLCAVIQACATPPLAGPRTAPGAAAPVAEARTPVTILVSLDGFRPDYRARGVSPNLDALADAGVSASIRPSFPSITFPNHYTLVTGLRPDRHGVVGNKMEDPGHPGAVFDMKTADPYWWDEAEPIWVSAERAGIRTATLFWPGSSAAIGGVRPSDWQQYNAAVTPRQRVDALIDWLRRPAETRPRFLTLYFEEIDEAGHDHGPDSAEVNAAVAEADAAIGRLRAGLAALGQPVNLVIVSDHGMARIADDRIVRTAELADPADFRVVTDGAYAGLEPVAGHEAALAKRLRGPHHHVTCWARAKIPARFHYGRNPRVPSFVCLADVGWRILEKVDPKYAGKGGTHGYDNDALEMRALFIASGPGIRRGGTLPTFDNVDVAPLLRDLIGLPPGNGLDGDDAPFQRVLVR